MNDARSDLDMLFAGAPPATTRFDPAAFAHLPPAVQRYLAHAIAPGTPLAHAVRLRMHGEIRVKRWRSFVAEQVIVRGRGMVWRARVKMGALLARGFDRYVDGEGAVRWKACGLLTLARGEGSDVTRSAAGRFAAESIWLPSTFTDPGIEWSVAAASDTGVHDEIRARFAVDGESVELALATSLGSLQSVTMKRWGNPGGGPFAWHDFGAQIEQEAIFAGYTIPARVRVGWHPGTPRFAQDGDFFHATIDQATFR